METTSSDPGLAPHDTPETPASPRTCSRCAAPMSDGQDWCLACGAGAPGSLTSHGMRSLAAVLVATAVLALGAAAAAIAALSRHSPAPARVASVQVHATTPAAAPAATAPGTAAATPASTAIVKPPKIPLTATVPPASKTTPAKASTKSEKEEEALEKKEKAEEEKEKSAAATKTGTTTTPGSGESEETRQAITLDTNAASTYNPYSYPAEEFGDPSLTIDGDSSTAWFAQVRPQSAPLMAEGLLVKVGSARRLGALELITSTPGLTVQIYGSTAAKAPTTITDKAWVPLTNPLVIKQKHMRLKLRHSASSFSLVALWISRAPASSVGTPQTPGHVDVNEVELFPAS